VKLLLLYGLVLFGLVQCVLAQNVPNPDPPHELIVAPEPEGVEKEEEEVEVDPDIKQFGIILNGINLCANIANNSFLPHVGNCSSFIECYSKFKLYYV